jgi:hypothetical protein
MIDKHPALIARCTGVADKSVYKIRVGKKRYQLL